MGSVVSGLFGKGGSDIAGRGIEEAARRAEKAYFRPYTVTTTSGTTSYGDGGFSSQLSPEYQALLGTTLGGAQNLFGQFSGFDPAVRAQELFAEQAAGLTPEFQKQATALQSRLFGSGRLGLRLAGESQGLGAGSGMVQPDALGLGQAQQQTLAQLMAQSRTQAFGEQAQLGQMASGLLGAGTQISSLEGALIAQGLSAEQARAAAALGAGQLAVAPYSTAADMAQRQQESTAGFFGSLAGGIGAAMGGGAAAGSTAAAGNAAILAAGMSDIRLKENITKTGQLANGLNLYKWDWKDDSMSDPTNGVIAQEVLEKFPEAVLTHDSGYLMVNYAHPELQGAR
jgi:hypothetical protein